MKAIFKSDDMLIINSADSTERLLANSFVEKANSGEMVFEVNKLVDINGDIAGMSLALVKPEPNPEEPEEGESNITNSELEDNTEETVEENTEENN